MWYKLIVVVLVLASLLGYKPQRISADDPVITFEQHMTRIFGDKTEIAIAVLKHESGLRLDAKNYNCFYYNKNGKRYSTFCKPSDYGDAWSVDCGIAQINVPGTICPKRLLTLEGNVEQVEKIYREQGLNAWVSYTNGKYKQFLKKKPLTT